MPHTTVHNNTVMIMCLQSEMKKGLVNWFLVLNMVVK